MISPDYNNLRIYFKGIDLQNIKIPNSREFNFWREEEKDETVVCIDIPHTGEICNNYQFAHVYSPDPDGK